MKAWAVCAVGLLFAMMLAGCHGEPHDETGTSAIETPGGSDDGSGSSSASAGSGDGGGQDSEQGEDSGSETVPPSQPNNGASSSDTEGSQAAGEGNLTISFVDVGQGDGIVLSTDAGIMVVDTANRFSSSYQPLLDHLSSINAAELEAVVVTHPDADHSGGCNELLEAYVVKRIYHPGMGTPSQTWADCDAAMQAEGAQIFTDATINPGDMIEPIPGWSMQVLHIDQTRTSDPNEGGIVLLVKHELFSIVLTGDIACETEDDILARGFGLDVAFLKVAHHGSKHSTCDAWLSATTPTHGFITVGNNGYGHPAPEALGRLEAHCVEVLRTDLAGTITLSTDGDNWQIATANGGLADSGKLSVDGDDPDCDAPPAPSPSPSPPPSPSPTPPPPPPPSEPQEGVVISDTQFDPPGDDQGDNLVNEWVQITNHDAEAVSFSGWTLKDEADFTYTFPSSFSLGAGASVKVRTGQGTDTATDLYWGRGSAVWNNGGDTAFLYDSAGTLVDSQG